MGKRITTEATYLKAMAQACSPEDWAEIIQKVVEQAKQGDLKAAAFLAGQLLREAPQLWQIEASEAVGKDQVKEEIRRLKQLSEFDFARGPSDKEIEALLRSLQS